MTPELEALARRAVACPRWRWMPGMRWTVQLAGGQSLADRAGRILTEWDAVDDGGRVFRLGPDALPDLTDPATLGCLLALVREAYGSTTIYCRLSSTTRASDGVWAWEVIGWLDPLRSPDGRGGSFRGWGYASEAEALVAALEAAP